jgi:type IV pilus assembly protein PilA
MFQSVLRRLRDAQDVELEGGGTAEAGFTLIELMVVLLIIAILLAIAIPTFLGVTSSANDRAAQSNLTNALTEASAVYQSNNQTYSGIQTAVTSSAPEFTWSAGTACTASQTNCISIAPVDVNTANDGQGVVLATYSKTGLCWFTVQLQATPASITTGETGSNVSFISAASTSPGGQTYTPAGGSSGAFTTAGTYYASKKLAVASCEASYVTNHAAPDASAGFNWGPSYSSPGIGG